MDMKLGVSNSSKILATRSVRRGRENPNELNRKHDDGREFE